VEVRLQGGDGQQSAPARMSVGRKLADDLHMVANPPSTRTTARST
jgi:hypothetical protein